MGDRKAFFYGTLMSRQVLFRVIYNMANPSKHETQKIIAVPATLHDHRRQRVRYADYPGVIPATGSSVRGTYVTGLTDADITKLDLFEGSDYVRRFVKPHLLETEGDAATGAGNVEGKEVDAETYIWVGGKENLEDKEWDFATFEREKMRSWVGGDPNGEFSDLEDAMAQQDGTGGRGVNGHIGQALQAEHEKANEGQDADEPLKSAV